MEIIMMMIPEVNVTDDQMEVRLIRLETITPDSHKFLQKIDRNAAKSILVVALLLYIAQIVIEYEKTSPLSVC